MEQFTFCKISACIFYFFAMAQVALSLAVRSPRDSSSAQKSKFLSIFSDKKEIQHTFSHESLTKQRILTGCEGTRFSDGEVRTSFFVVDATGRKKYVDPNAPLEVIFPPMDRDEKMTMKQVKLSEMCFHESCRALFCGNIIGPLIHSSDAFFDDGSYAMSLINGNKDEKLPSAEVNTENKVDDAPVSPDVAESFENFEVQSLTESDNLSNQFEKSSEVQESISLEKETLENNSPQLTEMEQSEGNTGQMESSEPEALSPKEKKTFHNDVFSVLPKAPKVSSGKSSRSSESLAGSAEGISQVEGNVLSSHATMEKTASASSKTSFKNSLLRVKNASASKNTGLENPSNEMKEASSTTKSSPDSAEFFSNPEESVAPSFKENVEKQSMGFVGEVDLNVAAIVQVVLKELQNMGKLNIRGHAGSKMKPRWPFRPSQHEESSDLPGGDFQLDPLPEDSKTKRTKQADYSYYASIPGAIRGEVPIVYYPSCSPKAYYQPAILNYCTSYNPN